MLFLLLRVFSVCLGMGFFGVFFIQYGEWFVCEVGNQKLCEYYPSVKDFIKQMNIKFFKDE